MGIRSVAVTRNLQTNSESPRLIDEDLHTDIDQPQALVEYSVREVYLRLSRPHSNSTAL